MANSTSLMNAAAAGAAATSSHNTSAANEIEFNRSLSLFKTNTNTNLAAMSGAMAESNILPSSSNLLATPIVAASNASTKLHTSQSTAQLAPSALNVAAATLGNESNRILSKLTNPYLKALFSFQIDSENFDNEIVTIHSYNLRPFIRPAKTTTAVPCWSS